MAPPEEPISTSGFDERQSLLQLVSNVRDGTVSAWHGFIDFLDRDNVLEVAVGLILAAAFTSVVSSFVSDILAPILSLLPFINKNFDEKFAVLRAGHNGQRKYNTVTQALEDGAIILAWGSFIGKVFNFVGYGFALYLIAKIYSSTSHDNIIKRTVRCSYCRKYISYSCTTLPLLTL